MAWDDDYFYSLLIKSDNRYRIRFANMGVGENPDNPDNSINTLPLEWPVKRKYLYQLWFWENDWNEEEGEWDFYPEIRLVGGGRYKETLICVNDKGNIYYGDI